MIKKAHAPKGLQIQRRRIAGDLPSAAALAARKASEVARLVREAIASARANRRRLVAQIRQHAKEKIQHFRTTNAERKKKVLRMLAESLARNIAQANADKAQAIAHANAQFDSAKQRAQARKAAARHHTATIKHHRASHARVKAAARMREKRGEQFDEVRSNVAATNPELIPYLEKVIGKLKHSAKRSRTEHFFQLVHDHPEAAIIAAQKHADSSVAQLMKGHSRSWETRARAIEHRIIEKVRKQWARSKPFRLSPGDLRALRTIGIDPEQIEMIAYKPARRIVSGRGASARASAPF